MGVIVAFTPVDSHSAMVSLDRATVEVEDMDRARRVIIKPLVGTDAKERGQELARLLARHRPIKIALGIELGMPAATEPSTIYFRLAASFADALPWEQLYVEPQGFVALDMRWPIARIAKRVHDVDQPIFEPPLRLVAVLSAAARDGIPQLRAIADSLRHAKTKGLETSLHVITGDPLVLAEVTTLADAGITGEPIEADPIAVVRQIAAARPHILHVLCHGGYAAPGVMGLSFATRRDFLQKVLTGRVTVSFDALAGALKSAGPWLVVLAACETANAAVASPTAHELVNSGIPAVIGMRRIVDLTATDLFVARVYPELLDIVANAVGQAGSPRNSRLEWAPALTSPRLAATTGVEPARDDAWSDPVLYVQRESMVVHALEMADPKARERAELRKRLDEYQLFAKTLDASITPKEVIAAVEAEIQRLTALLTEAEG